MQKVILGFTVIFLSVGLLQAKEYKDMSVDELIATYKKSEQKVKEAKKQTQALEKIRKALEEAKNQKATKK